MLEILGKISLRNRGDWDLELRTSAVRYEKIQRRQRFVSPTLVFR